MAAMRRPLVGLTLLLAIGCAGRARPVPTPAALAAAPVAPAIEVRATPPELFIDPARRSKLLLKLPAVREAVAEIVASDRLIGVAVGVVVDGELVLAEGFGARHARDGGAIDARTVFRIGSITKVFTATAALRLVETGRLDLDAPASTVLPELARLASPSADARRISVRDILTHTAGLPRNPDVAPLAVDDAVTRDELMRAIDGLSLVRAPGVAYEYSNLGFALLGHLVAAASGRPYHDEIRGAVLTPLGMRSTVWERDDVPAQRLAIGHVVEDGRIVVQPPTRHGDIDAAGGLFSTVEDLGRFVGFQLAAWPPRGGADDGPLTRATIRETHALRVGLTWRVTQGCDGVHVVSHNGAVDGYHASVRMLANAGIGIVVLANASWADTGHIAEEIQRVLARDGGLELRAPQVLPILTTTATELAAKLSRWDDAAFAAQATLAWRDDDAIPRLGARLRWLHAALGPCTLGPLRRPTSAWSGVFGLVCERGTGELALTLTTTATPKISGLEVVWTGGTPTASVQTAAAAAVALLERFDAPTFVENFSPAVRRTTFERLDHRACKLGPALAVGGPDSATFALTCARGAAKLSLSLDRGEPARIAAFTVVAEPKPPCR